ncbi:hypothetical protein [Arthrobacter russicus]|jgi:predicted Na+-dependent transporter|uniref:Na+-dependent transporter n=1 Tax=Arthrobacter russicus TaxID=172040 RepID=A0ABU1JD80_9MICC|nr:hypothetical protein [Arthrobacter russicus]MBQ1443113.1 hypothetical protein [Renibacterium sp.]MDN5667577.1 hypothetical protein [Renibacterium salmoninarum]MDR6270100.1 putative Na+-dependent transporter [Arthrobacter russicus]
MTEPASGAAPQPEETRVSIRRAPKFVPFLIAGAILGIIAAVVVAVVPQDSQYDKSTVFGFFVVLLIIAGTGLGGLVALVIDWLGRRKATVAYVEETTEPDPGEPAGA